MANNIKGITIEIDGSTTGLDKALSSVNKQAYDLQKELKEVEKQLKFDPKNTELLSQKQELLAKSVSNTKDKLKQLKDAQDEVNQGFKDGTVSEEQYRAFNREVEKTQSQLKELGKNLNSTEKDLNSFANKAKEAGDKLKGVGDKMTDVGKDLSMKVTAPLVAVGGASFLMAADLEDAMGATDQIFKGSAEGVKEWAAGLESHYGIAEGEALGYSNTMGAMLQNIGGLTEEEAAKQSQTLVELAGDLSATFGGSTESAIQALTGALKGNNSMLDNYGMGVNDATVKAKAFEMGLYSGTGEIDLQAKQAATLALVMEQTSASQGQAAREAEGASGSMKSMTTEVKNLGADIGQVLIPIIVPLIESIKGIVEWFKNLDPETKNTIVTIGLIVAAVGPLLVIFGTLIGAIGSIIGALGGMIAFFSAGGAGAAVLTAAATALGIGIGPLVAIIAGVIAVGALLIANWDEIKAFAGELLSALSEKFNAIKEAISEAITAAKEALSQKWAEIKQSASEAWENVKQTAKELWDGIKTNIIEPITAAWEKVKEIADNIKNTISEKFTEAKTKVEEIFNAIKLSIEEKIGLARDAVSTAIDKIKGFFNFEWKWPEIKMPKFGIVGSLNPATWLTNGLPKLTLDWYDKGGIFNSPSIIGVGEKRPEFVGALDDLKDIVRSVMQESPQTGVIVSGNRFTIREEADVRKVAEQLYRLETKKRRGGQ